MEKSIEALLEEVQACAERRQQLLNELLRDHGNNPLGIELVNSRCQYITVLEEPGKPGAARLLYFDEQGLSGHSEYASPVAALEEALRMGYRERAPGSLDRLSATPAWHHGTQVLELWHAVHNGLMTIEEARSRKSALDLALNGEQTCA